MITIVDYGMGNLRSVENAFRSLGVSTNVTREPSSIRRATSLILPGVGSFQRAMENLRQRGLDEALYGCWEKCIPILGICLGMQLFATQGDEGGGITGLRFVSGRVSRLLEAPKLPHVGWNTLKVKRAFLNLSAGSDDVYMYFTHSYYLAEAVPSVVSVSAHYGVNFPVAVEQNNLFGVQFHPEKSGAQGIRLLREFARRAGERPC